MFSSRDAYENDFCPVRDELLGEMYRANENGLPRLVETVTPDVRAMLALFCYRRSHLHSLAVAIAASCNERDLIERGGGVGGTRKGARPDGERRPRRLDALCAGARRRGEIPAVAVGWPQADHAVD